MECRVLAMFRKAALGKGRIGLAFGTDEIAVAVARRANGGTVLERCELLGVDPAAGVEGRAAAIRAAGLPRVPASAVLQLEDYRLALVEAPDVPPAELRAAMRWRLKDTIDFRIEDAVIDVFDVPEHNRGGRGRMMYAVAARRSAIDGYNASFAGLSNFDVIDVPELCLRNLAALLPSAPTGVALLHLHDTTATIVLVRGKTFYLARHTDLGSRGKQAAGDREARVDAAGVVLELQRSLDYYERHFDQPPITRIAISPPGKRAAQLAADLGNDTGFEVTTLDLNVLLSCEAPIADDVQAGCLLAVGAALREEHRSL